MRSGRIVRGVAVGILVVALAAVATIDLNTSEGRNSELNAFKARYPAAAGTRLDTCGTCHYDFGGAGDLNAYGEEYLNAGSFAAIESLDSDGDGTSNLAEINVLFMPGLSCTTYTLASGAPAGLADYVDPQRPGCTATTATPTSTPTATATHTPTPTATSTPTPSDCGGPDDTDGDCWPDTVSRPGFSAESFLTTDPLNACTPNGWPPDSMPASSGDGLVAIDDTFFVSSRFGYTSDISGYTSRAELASPDGDIGIDDIFAVASRFWEVC